jgi:hypothetical protein
LGEACPQGVTLVKKNLNTVIMSQVYHIMKLVDDGEEMKRKEGSGRPNDRTKEREREFF